MEDYTQTQLKRILEERNKKRFKRFNMKISKKKYKQIKRSLIIAAVVVIAIFFIIAISSSPKQESRNPVTNTYEGPIPPPANTSFSGANETFIGIFADSSGHFSFLSVIIVFGSIVIGFSILKRFFRWVEF